MVAHVIILSALSPNPYFFSFFRDLIGLGVEGLGLGLENKPSILNAWHGMALDRGSQLLEDGGS